MTPLTRRITITVLLSAAVLTMAGLVMHAAAPTTVATVRVRALRDNLAQEAANREQLRAMTASMRATEQSRMDEIKKLEEELKNITDPDAKDAMIDKLNLKKLGLQVWGKQVQLEFEIERSLRFEEMHSRMTKTIAEMADMNGYDLVIVDDSSDEPMIDPDGPPPAVQRAQQLAIRRVLYRGKTIDITDDLAVRMNNAFKAGAK